MFNSLRLCHIYQYISFFCVIYTSIFLNTSSNNRQIKIHHLIPIFNRHLFHGINPLLASLVEDVAFLPYVSITPDKHADVAHLDHGLAEIPEERVLEFAGSDALDVFLDGRVREERGVGAEEPLRLATWRQ